MSGGRETFSPPPVLCSYIRIQVDSLFFFFFFLSLGTGLGKLALQYT